MCISAPKVKIPKTPPPAQLQMTQLPKDMTQNRDSARNKLRRRGLMASIFTSPRGLTTAPTVTGGGGGYTGG
jgi:hypothetical protein